MPYLGTIILKNYCHISNQHPQICKFANFGKKQKRLNLGPKIPFLDIFGLEFTKSVFVFEINTLKFVKMSIYIIQ